MQRDAGKKQKNTLFVALKIMTMHFSDPPTGVVLIKRMIIVITIKKALSIIAFSNTKA